MKKIWVLASMISLISGSGFADAQSRPDIRVNIQDRSRRSYNTEPRVTGMGDTEAVSADSKILNHVQSMIQDIYSNYNINIDVSDGTVHLTGAVNSQQDIKNIEKDVRGVPGVREVHNRLTLK